MSTRNLCFHGEITKILFAYSTNLALWFMPKNINIQYKYILRSHAKEHKYSIRIHIEEEKNCHKLILTAILGVHVSQNFLVFSALVTSVLEVLIRCSKFRWTLESKLHSGESYKIENKELMMMVWCFSSFSTSFKSH